MPPPMITTSATDGNDLITCFITKNSIKMNVIAGDDAFWYVWCDILGVLKMICEKISFLLEPDNQD